MNNVITIAGVAIRQDDHGRYSLNDLHRAAGEQARHKPGNWTALDQTKEIVAEIEIAGNPAIQSKQGLGTFVCKELVYAYAMWISAAFHLKVIRAYDLMVSGMQAGQASQHYHVQVPKTLPEALRLAAAEMEKNAVLQAELNDAVRTKALIGNKREATAMATASTAKREAERLRRQLGRNKHHATIIAVEQVTGMRFAKNAYVGLRRWCKAKGVSPVEVVDERYGSVKAWPAGAWLDVHDINLRSLFDSLVGDSLSISGQ